MPQEIERRYLVRTDELPTALPEGKRLTQGYLSFEPVVRVRLVEAAGQHNAYLTIKGRGTLVRSEFEYAVPEDEAREMLALCGAWTLQKIRYRLGPWELDRFLGRHDGLWLAELELPAEDAPLPNPLPPWLGREVTDQPQFTNSNLVRAANWRATLGEA